MASIIDETVTNTLKSRRKSEMTTVVPDGEVRNQFRLYGGKKPRLRGLDLPEDYASIIPEINPRSRHLVLIVLVAFVVGFFMGDLKLFVKDQSRDHSSSTKKASKAAWATDDKFWKHSQSSPRSNAEKRHVEPIEILGELSTIRAKLERRLRGDYGDYFASIFDEKMMSKLFHVSDVSMERLLRRIIVKAIPAILDPKVDVTFTWATGGDSAAAGHGNLFSQSYTAVMEDTVREAFAASGIKFVAKNYAMGDYPSAPELALCMESIYGTDLDILSWDFSLSDVGYDHRLSLWGYRAGVHPTKPILVMMDTSESDKWGYFSKLQKIGLGAVFMDKVGLSLVKSNLPDALVDDEARHNVATKGGQEEGQRDGGGGGVSPLLPPPLRNFMCGGFSESAYPCNDNIRHWVCSPEENSICMDEKYDIKEVCRENKYQKSWNPGWKEHFLKGRLLGYFMIEMLHKAIVRLDYMRRIEGNDDVDLEQIYKDLMIKENFDKETFRNAQDHTMTWTDRDQDTLRYATPAMLSRRNVICRTALLPSHYRYEGILAETVGATKSLTQTVKNPQPNNNNNDDLPSPRRTPYYYEGINKDTMTKDDAPLPNGSPTPLAYDPSERQKCENHLEIDFKDFFYVRASDGWTTITVPSRAEIRAYGDVVPEDNMGYILICPKICPFGKCTDVSVDLHSIPARNGIVSVKVNGKKVFNIKRFGRCQFLEGDRGLRWPFDRNGQYKLEFNVEETSRRWMKISSVIIIS